MFNKIKKNIIQSRKNEEWLYEKVLAEVESGNIRRGLYAKALSQSDGDEKKAQSIYLKLRVQSIIDDDEELRILQEEQNSSLMKMVLIMIQSIIVLCVNYWVRRVTQCLGSSLDSMFYCP